MRFEVNIQVGYCAPFNKEVPSIMHFHCGLIKPHRLHRLLAILQLL